MVTLATGQIERPATTPEASPALPRHRPRVLIIGAGSTGAATAHDLALRGLDVTVVERGEIASGTTGRNHGLLHSGGRYAVKDPESAVECIDERDVLARIAPEVLELNGGLFVALDESDLAYQPAFLDACDRERLPYRRLRPAEALALEPALNPRVLAAIEVADGVFDPLHLCLAFLATARANGARIHPDTEVERFVTRGATIAGAVVRDRRTDSTWTIAADVVINAAGPWAGKVAALAGVDVPVVPTAGVMVAVLGRWVDRVVNRMNRPADGDIVVPQRRTVMIGTSSWQVADPDRIAIPPEHVALMLERGSELIPGLRGARSRGIFAAARPLVGRPGAADGRELSRTFECFDHAADGAPGLVTISGGKTTTARAMAQQVSDLVCARLEVDAVCRTRDVPLRSYRAFYDA